jgi:hypothetical protein
MTELSDIFHSAFTKDAVGLKAAVDAALSARSQEAVSNITADVAASMFGMTVGDEVEVDSSDTDSNIEDSSQEEQTDEAL